MTGVRLLRELRVGRSWSAKGGMTTVVEVGTGPEDEAGRRPDDRLVGVLLTPELAESVCALVNDSEYRIVIKKEEDQTSE